MKSSVVITAAFAMLVAAALPEEQQQRQSGPDGPTSTSELNTISVLNLLATALPQSLLELAYTNPPALSSVVASEFAASQTPDWFSALPSNVQSYLIPQTTVNMAPAIFLTDLPTAVTRVSTSHPTTTSAHSVVNTSATYPGHPGNSTMGVVSGSSGTATSHSTRHTAATTPLSITTIHTARVSSSVFSTSYQSTGGAAAAALPTAVLGPGLVGALGVAGLFII